MKILSMYLPQFHRVKENDEWWGEGFTEWTTVKGAVPVYEGHNQPKVPLDKNYYDLLQRETMQWQADLMRQYGIDGQCIYHYWFKDGRQILEKPTENLLKWTEIDMPFCFCWANETWARTWSQVASKNAWTSKFENKNPSGKDDGILLEQKYGDENDWKKHFEYLLPFFRDDRYIKIDNKPLFLIYKPAYITCLQDMLERWRNWAIAERFEGIYIIAANSNVQIEKHVDKILFHEPVHTIDRMGSRLANRTGNIQMDYSEIWEKLLDYQTVSENVSFGAFVGYDDTPRRGGEGTVIANANPHLFRKYLSKLTAKNMANGNDIIFINAWNEWGEGMYLEPDEENRYGYLEAVLYARNHYDIYLDEFQNKGVHENFKSEIESLSFLVTRYESYWRTLDAWLRLKETGVKLESYFTANNMHSIAIYGMGMLGKHLYNELSHSSIEIKYAIDRKAEAIQMDIRVYDPEDSFPQVDAIVVTAAYSYSYIRKKLVERGYRNIISLEHIIMEMI